MNDNFYDDDLFNLNYNNPYKNSDIDITQFVKNTGIETSNAFMTFNNDIIMNGELSLNKKLILNNNLISNNKVISPNEIEQLDGIDVNIKQTLNNLSNNIGGVFTNNNTYSGDGIYLGNASFNQMSLTTNNITKTLNAQELSYLDGVSSNIQTQLNNKNNLISNPVNNNLSSMNSLGQCINNNISITTDNNLNTTSDVLIPSTNVLKNYVQNKIDNISMNTAIGRPKIMYLSNIIDANTGYETMNFKPNNELEDIENVILNNNRVLFHSYITSNPLNISKINAGLWSSYIYGYVDDATAATRFELELYIRTTSNVETLFLTMISNDINNLSVNAIQFNATLNTDVNINLTDKLVIKVYGFSNANKNIKLYLYHGGNIHNSFINTSIVESHNDLNGLDVGDFQHLSQTQKIKATQLSTSLNDGLLSSSDWNMFNNKENYIAPSTINHYYRGDKSFQILNKNSVLLNNVDNTSDLNKPISSATQTALNLKNDIINSSTNLLVNTISDNIGNLRTSINNLTNKFYQIIYVGGQFGSDTNLGYTINNPKQTIQNALNDSLSNTGINLLIMPWIYNENITISRQNITIASVCYEKGGLVNITGDTTITSANSSVRLSGITFNNLIISGNTNVYIDNCKIGGILNKTGGGYMEINNSSLSGQILLNSNSINNFLNNNIAGIISNNSTYNSLQCNFSNNLISGFNININSGVWGLSNSVIYSSSINVFSLMTNNVYLYLSNMSMLNPDNTPSKISLTNTYYSINNCYYNKASSVFTTSTKLNRTQHNEIMNIDTIYLNSFLNVNNINITPIQLSYLNGLTSNIQQQINNIDVSNYVSLNGVQTLTNKTLTDPKLTNNRLVSSSNHNINFIDVSDTIVNLNSEQILNNKTLNTPIISQIKVSTGNIVYLPNVNNQYLVNAGNTTSDIQPIYNKTLITSSLLLSNCDTPVLGDITQRVANTAFVNNELSNLNNRLLTNCTANTQLSTDNSTKIATTEFVKSVLSVSNTTLTNYSANVISTPLTIQFDNYILTLNALNNLTLRTVSGTKIISGGANSSFNGGNVTNFLNKNITTTPTSFVITTGEFFFTTSVLVLNIYFTDTINIFHITIIAYSITNNSAFMKVVKN
jgi:hypothetical protein